METLTVVEQSPQPTDRSAARPQEVGVTLGERARRLAPSIGPLFRLKRQTGRSILLTFDDGPHPETTPAVLDQLDRYEVKGIFFVVGNRIDRAPELLREIVARGHTLGNHSHSHDRHVVTSYWKNREDLRLCQRRVEELAGVTPRHYRPPYGALSVAGHAAVRKAGLQQVLWTLSSEDWACRSLEEARDCAKVLCQKVEARDILLFHDERRYVVDILERVLPELSSADFDLAPSLETAL